jgi:hypothetical protein
VSAPFSKRHGYARQKITARESAPKQLRSDILFAIRELWDVLGGGDLDNLCEWLGPILKQSSSSLWFGKFDKALLECPWFRFYDCVEDTFRFFAERSLKGSPWLAERAKQFEEQVNEAFEQNGVGWKLVEGQLQIRGDEGFEQSFQSALKSLTREDCEMRPPKFVRR